MNSTRDVHKLENKIHCIGYIRSSHSQILQGPTLLLYLVGSDNKSPSVSDNVVQREGSVDKLVFMNVELGKEILKIFLLREEEHIRSLLNLNP